MTTMEPWEQVLDAEREYIARRMALYSAGIEREQLALALASPQGVGMALRVLRDAPSELIMDLFQSIFAGAVATSPQVGTARETLARLDSGWLALVLPSAVSANLDREDASWEDYRRTAELLSFLGQSALLEEMIDRARRSDDEGMKEVVEDYEDGRTGTPD